ncbi:hypothetical protein F1643_17410 [Azospirillum sp. INR13]|uniref:hypothetical protein n=1 Tax=Azospirillum sp. INR13 TaxID=2596919 RepID=UPI0018926DC1|nr:hypothetical protein [Azospirillum sp. INR13]MBF5095923.1 hypothetical protein [Azospirillum sp. INR13]
MESLKHKLFDIFELEQEKGAEKAPIPSANTLGGWKIENNSPPFDEDKALRYLERTEKIFERRLGNFIDSISKK